MDKIMVYAESACRDGVCQSINVEPGAMAAILAFIGSFIIFFIIFALFSFFLWVWALADLLKRSEDDFKKIGNGDRSLWLMLLITSIFFGFYFIISIIYYLIIYRNTKKVSSSKE